MIAADHTLRDMATAHAASVLRLVDLFRASSAAQWDKSPGARMTTALGVSDPTGELATAPSRLARAGSSPLLACRYRRRHSLARPSLDRPLRGSRPPRGPVR